jgi:phospholipid/cholesterol/gamma-HCH transport system permease protein
VTCRDGDNSDRKLIQNPPKIALLLWFNRMMMALLLMEQVVLHLLKGKINRHNTLEQMSELVGPQSLMIALLTSTFVGMVFTIQVAREF